MHKKLFGSVCYFTRVKIDEIDGNIKKRIVWNKISWEKQIMFFLTKKILKYKWFILETKSWEFFLEFYVSKVKKIKNESPEMKFERKNNNNNHKDRRDYKYW